MSRTIAPYGTWTSTITPSSLVDAAVSLADVQRLGSRIVWSELRPSEGGRYQLVSLDAGDLLPDGVSARTQAHEYGGRCYAGTDDLLVYSNWSDQRLYVVRGDAEPVALTDPGDGDRTIRFADPVLSPDGRWIVAVRERHGESVVNDIVAIDLASGAVSELAGGHDFVASPRLSPDGERLVWVAWDHPRMPWDGTVLYSARFTDGAVEGITELAGGESESITQPRFSPDGRLHFVSDRSGWWNLYADDGGTGTPLAPADTEFGDADWVFGLTSYVFLDDGRLIATWGGEDGMCIGEVVDGKAQPWPVDLTVYDTLASDGQSIVAIAGSPTIFQSLVRIDPSGEVQVLRRSRELTLDPADISVAREVTYPSAGELSHAWYYPPVNPAFEAPAGELPPLVVMSHGGPTSASTSLLKLPIQFWTSRGFAVADVNYRGSTGYGRVYRDRLRDNWGVTDVEDCSEIVGYLAQQGLADPRRAVIRGGSAGGFTTLACLTFTDVFAAGASHYGIGDLALLARDTHKFESRYLDGLVAPWPDGEAVYSARSPLHHIQSLTCPIILFQGEEDMVVPQAQADDVFAALTTRGVPVAYLLFPGEQHGFRKAETIIAVAEAELAFYGAVLGFTPAGSIPVPDIVNKDALAR